jgi:hypothetical protein
MFMFKLKVFLRSVFGEGVWAVVQKMSVAPRHRLMRLVQRETRRTVHSGPFAGVRYLHDAVSGGYVPKLLGIYERELHGIINALPELGLRRVINIGASDGYYAVGLAQRLPEAQVVAFEIEPRGQEFVRRIAEQNGVGSRVIVQGRCDVADLQAVVDALWRTLVICDVEGFENVLLNPDEAPALGRSWILVELHDGKMPGVSDLVRKRFEGTHMIRTIWQQKRTAADFPFSTPYTRKLAPQHLEAAVNEGRPVRDSASPMHWFWMAPKAYGSQ